VSSSPCPEDLIARAPDELLGAAERSVLDRHLAECASCRTELDVALALRGEPVVLAGDDRFVSLLAARVSGSTGLPPRASRLPMGAKVAILVAGAATAGVVTVRHLPASKRVVTGPVAVSPRPESADEQPAILAASHRVAEAPLAVSSPRMAGGARLNRDESGAMLRTAREARARGDRSEALRLYQLVRRRYPGSPVADVADVATGMLILESPSARPEDVRRALGAFENYLSAEPEGALEEESLVGRARCLEALGQSTEEVSAWRDLVSRFPGSLHAKTARHRIEAIEQAATGSAQ
jgi:Tetratricopeptide repeat